MALAADPAIVEAIERGERAHWLGGEMSGGYGPGKAPALSLVFHIRGYGAGNPVVFFDITIGGVPAGRIKVRGSSLSSILARRVIRAAVFSRDVMSTRTFGPVV